MKTIKEYIKSYKYPAKYYYNPNIEDWMEINHIEKITEDIQYDFERIMWNHFRGPKYNIWIENVVYENINNSYDPDELYQKLVKKFNVSNGIYAETNNNVKSFTFDIDNENLINDEEFKSLLNFYNYYVSFCEKRNNKYQVYIEPYKPEEKTNYIYNDCKGIVYRFVDDNGLKRIENHGLAPRHDKDRYYPRYIFVIADKDENRLKDTFFKVQREIKKNNLHLIRIDLNKYENKLRFYVDPASVNYDAFVTREYIPKYCCEEIKVSSHH